MSVEGTGLTAKLLTTATTVTYERANPFSFFNGTYMVNATTTTNFDIKSFSIALRAVNDEDNQNIRSN